MSQKKQRLDVRLAEEGCYPSREKARAAVMAGLVFVNGQRADKPGLLIKPQSNIEIRGSSLIYVSRGGLKLEKAIKSFSLDLNDRIVLDVGASTGGFTDCALMNGARLVYAVDVGYGQLAWRLRNDPRVVVLERTNIRYLAEESLPETPDFVTIDVSFISLSKVLPKIGELTAADAEGMALVKPQFEAGRDKVGKKGVVRDPGVHVAVLHAVTGVVKALGWVIGGLDYSPVTGPKGNIEFLIYFKKNGSPVDGDIDHVVKTAHVNFGYLQA
ncbi:MAG: TlyA family RNA methyltransferase [Desulfotomaculaceae bacterium]|nr:TlyA family RNA methyltransferase [Desulfotomaculaceae bacterium]